MQIELDAFSGVPNPRWELTSAQAAELLALLHRLKPCAAGPPADGGLGYRGFIVRADGGPVDGYDEVCAYRGAVVARRGEGTETLADSGRDVERFLLRAAAGHVAEPVLQYVGSEIEAGDSA